jgi:hypothetical protein
MTGLSPARACGGSITARIATISNRRGEGEK